MNNQKTGKLTTEMMKYLKSKEKGNKPLTREQVYAHLRDFFESNVKSNLFYDYMMIDTLKSLSIQYVRVGEFVPIDFDYNNELIFRNYKTNIGSKRFK